MFGVTEQLVEMNLGHRGKGARAVPAFDQAFLGKIGERVALVLK